MARLLAVAATTLAVSSVLASPAEGQPAAQSVSRVVSCATAERAMQFSAFASNPALKEAVVGINTGSPQVSNPLLWLDTHHTGYTVGDGCHAARKHRSFTHRGLTSAGVVKAGDNRSSTVYCHQACPHALPHRLRLGGQTVGCDGGGLDSAGEEDGPAPPDRLRDLVAATVGHLLSAVGVHEPVGRCARLLSAAISAGEGRRQGRRRGD
jgi:hypothetical protein